MEDEMDSPRGLRSVSVRLVQTDQVQDREQQALFRYAEAAEHLVVELIDRSIELGQELQALLGDVAQDLAPVLVRTRACDEALVLQPIDQARDARRGLDHALGDLERRQAARSGAAQ